MPVQKLKDNIEINNFVVITGKIINEVKGGLTNSGSFYLSFVIASPKGEFLNLVTCNYVPVTVFGDKFKNFIDKIGKDDWVKVIGKINTFRAGRGPHKWQVLAEEIELVSDCVQSEG